MTTTALSSREAAGLHPKASSPSATARIGALLYGSLVYVGFLLTFLYAIGFVSGLVVPKTLDSGSAGAVLPALLINTGLLLVFAIQHNIMARQWFKRIWTRIVPAPVERSTFVLFTCLALNLMYWNWQPIGGTVWSVEQPIAAAALHGLGMAGWLLVLVATFLIDHFDLFGLRQVIRYALGKTHEDPAFRVKSLYRYVRHPLYLGFVIAFWATPTMTWGHLFFAVVTTAFMIHSIRLEERDLVRAHGRAYEEYRERVPMLVPVPGRTW